MMLKDKQGRTVLVRQTKTYGVYKFWARDGFDMSEVDEAIVSEGEEAFLTKEQIDKMLADEGFSDVQYEFDPKRRYAPVHIDMQEQWEGYGWRSSSQNKKVYHVGARRVDEPVYKRCYEVVTSINSYNPLLYATIHLQKGIGIQMSKALEMIGEGKVVTPVSLAKGCAIDEDRPRLLPGDQVKVLVRKTEALGVIKSLNTNVVVLRQDGTKMTCAYDKVQRTEEDGHSEELASQVDSFVQENFDYTVKVGAKRIYRAKLEKADFVFPMFPDAKDNERQEKREQIMQCVCPVCGWRMADIHDCGEFICCCCKIRGVVVTRSEVEVTLLMLRWPAKNRFAIKETRCCANCGLFGFEHGRQGVRTTGYCTATNQCVQGFTVCDVWYPREPARYESNLRQHVTNLHYGVKDRRNTDRNDVRDTIYTEEDHKKEIERAEKAKIAYANAYQKFLKALREEAAKVPPVEEMTPELTEQWQKVLDDPC